MNHFSQEQQTLLFLLRRSLWGESCQMPVGTDWNKVDHIAQVHSVVPFAYDGAVAAQMSIPAELRQKWKKKVLSGIINNERLLRAQAELFDWFAANGISAVVLKGSSVARYYPQPELRKLGDIDVLINKIDFEAVQNILISGGYRMHEAEHEFHVGYSRPDAYVEIHYDVTKFPDSVGGKVAKDIFSHFSEETYRTKLVEHTFPVLSDDRQALSLLLHMISHMFSWGIGLRQLCDWAVYMANVDPDYFCKTVIPQLDSCGLLRYAKVATRASINYLGLSEKNMIWCADVDDDTCKAFMDEVFNAGNLGKGNQGGMGSLFTDSKGMGSKQRPAMALISRLNQLSYKNFPFTKKYKILLPLFWIYLPVRYYVRSMLGLRPKKSISEVVLTAQKSRDLYDRLALFEVQEWK